MIFKFLSSPLFVFKSEPSILPRKISERDPSIDFPKVSTYRQLFYFNHRSFGYNINEPFGKYEDKIHMQQENSLISYMNTNLKQYRTERSYKRLLRSRFKDYFQQNKIQFEDKIRKKILENPFVVRLDNCKWR